MSDIPRKKLIELINKHGPLLCNDPNRLEGLLRDVSSGYQREIFLLTVALKQHVCEDLVIKSAGVTTENLIKSLITRLCDNLGLAYDAARWAVVSWAIALNVIPAENLVSLQEAQQRVRLSATKSKTKSGRRKRGRPYSSVIVSPDAGGQYKTVQSAIEDVPSGARIFVRPGIYRENLTIEKSLEIIGEGRPSEVILESNDQSCLLVTTEHCVVHGLMVRQVIDKGTRSSPAIAIQKGNITLEDSILSPSQLGIAIQGSRSSPTIRRCQISGAADAGLAINPKSGGVIEDCTFTGNATGIRVMGKSEALIRHCSIIQGHIGVEIGERGTVIIEDCEIAGNTYAGAIIHQGADPEIRRCSISKGQFGIEVTDRGRGTLQDVQISNNAQGLLISQFGSPRIERCRVYNNQFGVRVTQKGKGVIEDSDISENEFAGISIKEGGDPTVRRCKVNKNGDVGIWIHKSGLGTLERNNLSGNRKGAFYIEQGSQVKRRANQE